MALAAMSAGFYAATMMDDNALSERSVKKQDNHPHNMQQLDFEGNLVLPPRKVSLPELTKHDGTALTNEDVQGHWSLVFFGYTNCPDICPMTLTVMAQARQQAEEDFPEVIFVSVDPARDKVEQLGEYVHYFDEKFTGVTGSPEMLKALTLQMSAVFMHLPAEPGNGENYLVDHTASIMLLNPEGKLHAFLRAPHTPAKIKESLAVVIKASDFRL